MRVHTAITTLFLAVQAVAQPATAWHEDFPAARRAAAEANQPLLLLFRCER